MNANRAMTNRTQQIKQHFSDDKARLAIQNGSKFVNETASLQTSAAKRRRENTNELSVD
jgi:hypothetical protein